MKRLLSVVMLGAMLLAACGGGPGSGSVAATVDGTEVTVGDVNLLLDVEGAVPVDQFARYLRDAIQFEILFTAAEEDFGISATDEEAEEEGNLMVEQSLTEGQSPEDFLSENGITQRYVTQVAKQNLIGTRIREQFVDEAEQPTAEELEQAAADVVLSLTEACVSHILVPTEEEAQEALDRLDAGEEFADVASELSTDGSAQSGGDLGCGSPAQYVEPFRDAVLEAPVGEVIPEPVESRYGYHVILVAELTEPAAEELPGEEDLASAVIGQAVDARLQDWYAGVLESADVTVEEEYGTWSPVPPTVTPPSTGTTTPGSGTDGTTTTTVSGE